MSKIRFTTKLESCCTASCAIFRCWQIVEVLWMKVGVIYSSIFLWEMLISYKSNVKEICIERAVQVMTWRQPTPGSLFLTKVSRLNTFSKDDIKESLWKMSKILMLMEDIFWSAKRNKFDCWQNYDWLGSSSLPMQLLKNLLRWTLS